MIQNKFMPKMSGNNFVDIILELKLRGKTTSFLTDKDVQFFEDLLSLMNIKITRHSKGFTLRYPDKEAKQNFIYYATMMDKFFASKKFTFPTVEIYNSKRKLLLFTLSYFDIEFFEENNYTISLMKPLDRGIFI